MRKLTVLLSGAVGYVLGSRAGRERYEQIKAKARSSGQFIVVEPEGIYSPLRHGEPIDPDRLVIVEYSSASGTARAPRD